MDIQKIDPVKTGPHLVEHGIAAFSVRQDGKIRYPAAVHDMRAAVQWQRSQQPVLSIDFARIALMAVHT
jgi:acetyl esterase/lipase